MVRASEDTAQRLRWQAIDRDRPQGELFPAPAGRIRHPEFRDLEFIHVRAKTIINAVPKASRVPFRYTINVYRGCSHACSYCLAGGTQILMADGTTTPLADVRPGDRVYGTVRRGSYRRYVVTDVLDHWQTTKPAYRIVLADGTELIASGDHRFLTDRGWKHVAGSEKGGAVRPHLTMNDSLRGTGRFSEPPKWTRDYETGYLCGMIRGDGHLGSYPYERPGRRHGEGDDRKRRIVAIRASARAKVDPEILQQTMSALDGLGFAHVLEEPRPNGCRSIRLTGGLREHLRFFHTVGPAITRKRTIPEGYALKCAVDLRVVAVEPLGVEIPMYDISTGTGDFIANGVVSHNCFARPTHEYLDLDAGRDFERVIVVKVNAVELLERELRPARWAGEHIAMGTNTDPYQRCEGRYELTRGVVSALTAVGNPFSILTKSPLVLRDLDLLVEADRRTDVGVNFSIGTLDTDVWRASEPGTPHPRKRLEAVAKLAEVGMPAGVLVAPIIPGLSDSRRQLRETVAACLEAGARSVSPIVLHLRPGVKEVFLSWLTEHRPDLLDRYRQLYPGSYAPRAEQDRITRLFHQIVRELGGPRPARPSQARRVPAPSPADPDPAQATQLRLL